MIKYITRVSKNWELVKLIFPRVDLATTYFTFGRNVYTPGHISDDLVIHEATHVVQQKGSYTYAIWWWIKYILSKEFRYSQELEAYANQLKFLLAGTKDKNQRFKAQCYIARCLANPIYNDMVSYDKAFKDLGELKTKRYE